MAYDPELEEPEEVDLDADSCTTCDKASSACSCDDAYEHYKDSLID